MNDPGHHLAPDYTLLSRPPSLQKFYFGIFDCLRGFAGEEAVGFCPHSMSGPRLKERNEQILCTSSLALMT